MGGQCCHNPQQSKPDAQLVDQIHGNVKRVLLKRRLAIGKEDDIERPHLAVLVILNHVEGDEESLHGWLG